jgi:hypothetical protein
MPAIKLPAHLLNEEVFNEAVALYESLTPATLAERSMRLLTPPTLYDRLAIASAMRYLGASSLFWLIPTAITVTRLYYLVSLLEGIVMPQLRMLVDLSEENGLGTRKELADARGNLSPAVSFLSGAGASALQGAPRLLAELQWLATDRVPHLRNAVAHLSFRLDETVIRADEIPTLRALGGLAPRALAGLARTLQLPEFNANLIPDYERSGIQYEEDLKKPITSRSRKRTYKEVADVVRRVEPLAFTLLSAAMEAAKRQQQAGAISLEPCRACKAATCSGVVGTTVSCPECAEPVVIARWCPPAR